VTDDPDDQGDGPPDADARPAQETDDRRAVWSHRIAVAVLVTFAAFVLFNLVIAYGLMMLDVFTLISFLLSHYANVVIAWLVTIATDIAINKRVLHISPRFPEFRRGMLHEWNPVGLVSVGLA